MVACSGAPVIPVTDDEGKGRLVSASKNKFLMRSFPMTFLQTCFLRHCVIVLALCSPVPALSQKANPVAGKKALADLLATEPLKSAHVGVLFYDDSLKQDLAAWQDAKFFSPASNTKLFSLYAGLKYLGDSLVGIRYFSNDTALFVFPSGEPGFLHPDFSNQPVLEFLKAATKKIYLVDTGWKDNALGAGWGWDEFNEDYGVERSLMPVYGNFVRWTETRNGTAQPQFSTYPRISWPVNYAGDSVPSPFLVQRKIDSNLFVVHPGREPLKVQDVPFITDTLRAARKLLQDTLGKPVFITHTPPVFNGTASIVYARPADSVFIPMMHRSDNFFAEQTLLMVSAQLFGSMDDRRVADTLLQRDLFILPQKPSWSDGSGLTRFNLFTPRDIVTLLVKTKNEFGIDRLKKILPTGGTGTLAKYYLKDSGYIFAKTGSLTGVMGLSGFLYTRKNRLLIFSILVNNYNGSGTAVRKAVEKYVEYIREKN